MQISNLPSSRRLGGVRVVPSAPTRYAVVANGKKLLEQDFDRWAGKQWKKATTTDANRNLWNKPAAEGAKLVKNIVGVQQGRLLLGTDAGKSDGRCKVNIKKGIWGLNPGGVGMKVELKDKVTEATLSYRMSFSKDYDWTLGGKLPGLASSGFPDGGRGTSGWSNRLMWRTFTREKNPSQARLVSYRYYPGQPNKFGEDLDWRYSNGQAVKINSAQSYRVKLYIKLNTPGKKNGIQQAWINGEKVLDVKNLVYRRTGSDSEKIGGLHWHVYHGGSVTDSRWKPDKNQSIWFDSFEIVEGRN